jgi:TolB protein
MRCRVLVFLAIGSLAGAAVVGAQDPDLRQLVTTKKPRVSPDGHRLVFESNATGHTSVWIADRDGSNARPLVSWAGSNQIDPCWSPDGQSIVFSSDRGSPRQFNLWTIRTDRTAVAQLTSGIGDRRQPALSPDGQRILFTSKRGGKRDIWVIGRDGSGEERLLAEDLQVSDPGWSPTADSIVYVGCEPEDGSAICHLFTFHIATRTIVQVTDGEFHDWHPHWGADGIVFASNRGAAQGLWAIGADGTGLRSLTAPLGTGDLHPRWDGGAIVFTRAAVDPQTSALDVWSRAGSGLEQRVTRINGFTVSGDVDVNGSVDCTDLQLVKSSFGLRVTQARFDTRADTNSDGLVDIRDLAVVSRHMPPGMTCQ